MMVQPFSNFVSAVKKIGVNAYIKMSISIHRPLIISHTLNYPIKMLLVCMYVTMMPQKIIQPGFLVLQLTQFKTFGWEQNQENIFHRVPLLSFFSVL